MTKAAAAAAEMALGWGGVGSAKGLAAPVKGAEEERAPAHPEKAAEAVKAGATEEAARAAHAVAG